ALAWHGGGGGEDTCGGKRGRGGPARLAPPVSTCSPARSELVVVALHRLLERVKVVDVDRGAAGDAGEGVVRQSRLEARRVLDHAAQPAEHGASARHGDAVLHEVGGELGGGGLERPGDAVDDEGDGLLERLADLDGGDFRLARQAADQVAPAHLDLRILGQLRVGAGGADLDLD